MFPNGTNTYAGIIVALAPTILSWAGFAPTPAFNNEFAGTLSAIITLIGGAYAIYGKLRHQIPTWVKKA